MSRVGRFFVSTNAHTDTSSTKGGNNTGAAGGASSGTPSVGGYPYWGLDKGARKRNKKCGGMKQYMPMSYPEPTIHEETSPTEGEDAPGVGPTSISPSNKGLTPPQPISTIGMSKDDSSFTPQKPSGVGPSATQGAGKTVGAVAKGEDATTPSLTPQTRQRSGTWSLATSRKARKERLEKEEEVQARQRRRSGDDSHMLSSTTPPTSKDRKKDSGAGGGIFDSIRPRSKSDAARHANKKPNFMTNIRQTLQHSLVSPGAGRSGGRRSGENTPPLDPHRGGGAHVTPGAGGEDYHHYTWHAGGDRPKSSIFKVFGDIFRSNPDEKRRRPSSGKAERGRRNSGDLHDRSRHSSGSLSSVYIRGSMAPDVVAEVFKRARNLPVTDPHLINILNEEDQSQILVKFFKLHHSYDLIPSSAKLVIFDTSLQVKKAFYALVHNGVRAAPLWDHHKQKFVGMLTITDFIRILQSFHHNKDAAMTDLEDHKLHMWRTMLKDEDKPLITITPEESLFAAISSLIKHKIHRLPVIDPATGNVLYIITHKRILKFLYLYIKELPRPSILSKTIGELNIGTYENIETASPDTLIIEALDKFVERRISALPIVDENGMLVDIYAKFDVLNLAAEGTYNNLDVTLSKANESRNEWFEGVLSCTREETLITVMDRIVSAEVHRLVVVDQSKKVVGVLSLSDILNEIVLKPAEEVSTIQNSTLVTSVGSVENILTDGVIDALDTIPVQSPADIVKKTEELELQDSKVNEDSPAAAEILEPSLVAEANGKAGSTPGDSEDEGRYSMDKSEESPPPSHGT